MTLRILVSLLVYLLSCGSGAAATASVVERAHQGDAAAQVELGVVYYVGAGVPENFPEAIKWWRKAADQGHADAQFLLGAAYWRGEGVATDRAEALKWFRKSAEQGSASHQYFLGRMYLDGDGVSKNSAEAAKWFRKAAEQGHVDAQFKLGTMYADGDGLAKNSTKAAEWYRKAALQGDATAQFLLGYMYIEGNGVAKDISEAAKWYLKAAEQGEAYAQFYLGNMYSTGAGVAKDAAQAVMWYRRSAEQGNVNAQGNLGSMYANGTGVAKDAIEGLAWSNIAAASGDEIFVKNRDLLERRVGPDVTLLAQQRSKQILKEIEAAKRAAASTTSRDPSAVAGPPKGSGSGSIVSAEGHVLTAAHVVAGASSVKIATAQGMKTASVLLVDEANDLAVLKLSAGTYTALPVAPSRRIRLGQSVATIGFPNIQIQGFSPKVTRGEISSLNGISDDPRAWQISVPVQTGNSGGPLLDENGSIIGVVVSKLGLKAAQATGDIPQNVNYAVKSTYALALLEPYLESSAPEPNPAAAKPRFEDMIAKAQQSVVLILVY